MPGPSSFSILSYRPLSPRTSLSHVVLQATVAQDLPFPCGPRGHCRPGPPFPLWSYKPLSPRTSLSHVVLQATVAPDLPSPCGPTGHCRPGPPFPRIMKHNSEDVYIAKTEHKVLRFITELRYIWRLLCIRKNILREQKVSHQMSVAACTFRTVGKCPVPLIRHKM
jgi:hypothetical protein